MALTKEIKADKVEIVGKFHHVQVRTATIVLDDDVELSRSFHRHVIAPGDDYSNEEQWVQDVCAAAHTPEIVAAYEAHLAEQAETDE
jgi:hypothetical protein